MHTADLPRVATTSGAIAIANLESARERAWNRFWQDPQQAGVPELLVELEQLTAQFTGTATAFDRLQLLVEQLMHAEPASARTALVAAQVACGVHRFGDARALLAQAVARGAPADATARLQLTIDQATGNDLQAVLATRRVRAAQPNAWAELIPLGALLADLGEFDEADRIYTQALRTYPDVSPFGPALASFQLGVLWGERMPEPDTEHAAAWYAMAIDYLPGYVKPRVHLAEIYLDAGRTDDAMALLAPVLASGDPEVPWRLADSTLADNRPQESSAHLAAAAAGFEALIARYPLAFADHGAEFYLGSGAQPARALELATLNVDNRPTARAFQLASASASAAGQALAAAQFTERARKHRNDTNQMQSNSAR